MPDPLSAFATRGAVRDLIAHGLRGALAHSQVGIELGQHLQGALTSHSERVAAASSAAQRATPALTAP